MSTATIPAGFVNLLREALEERLGSIARELGSGIHHRWSARINTELLEPFDAYRALLDSIGWKRTRPAAVEVDLAVHRWALESALRERLDKDRDLAELDKRSKDFLALRERARRDVKRIEAFMAGLGEDWRVRAPEVALHDSARKLLRANGVDPGDARAVYGFAERQAARRKRVVGPVPEGRHLEILRLRILDGLTLEEIGKRTGLTDGRIGTILGAYFGVSGTPAAAKARAGRRRRR
jgi:Sigma-70, region 4